MEESARESRVLQAIDKLHGLIIPKCKIKGCENGFIRDAAKVNLDGLLHPTSHKCECFQTYERYKSYLISNIPREFWKVKDEQITTDPDSDRRISIYLEKLTQAFENGIGLLFLGSDEGMLHPNNGVGKTLLGTKILEHAIASDYSAHYITMHSYFNLVYRSKDDADTYLPVIDEIEGVDFLCIDEVGKINDTDYVKNKFEDMIRYRSQQMLTNIIITNMNTKELTDMFGYSIMDIIMNSSVAIKLRGNSHRQQKFVDIRKRLNWGL